MSEIETLVKTLRMVIDQNKKNEAAVRELNEKLGKVIDQQMLIVAQLNKHSSFIVQHERTLARCLSCVNYAPRSDPHARTAAIKPRKYRSSASIRVSKA